MHSKTEEFLENDRLLSEAAEQLDSKHRKLYLDHMLDTEFDFKPILGSVDIKKLAAVIIANHEFCLGTPYFVSRSSALLYSMAKYHYNVFMESPTSVHFLKNILLEFDGFGEFMKNMEEKILNMSFEEASSAFTKGDPNYDLRHEIILFRDDFTEKVVISLIKKHNPEFNVYFCTFIAYLAMANQVGLLDWKFDLIYGLKDRFPVECTRDAAHFFESVFTPPDLSEMEPFMPDNVDAVLDESDLSDVPPFEPEVYPNNIN